MCRNICATIVHPRHSQEYTVPEENYRVPLNPCTVIHTKTKQMSVRVCSDTVFRILSWPCPCNDLGPYQHAVCCYFFTVSATTVCHCIFAAKSSRVLLHSALLGSVRNTLAPQNPTDRHYASYQEINFGKWPY